MSQDNPTPNDAANPDSTEEPIELTEKQMDEVSGGTTYSGEGCDHD